MTDLVGEGGYKSDRVKFYACCNEKQDVYGGGEYKIFAKYPDKYDCVPIYLGVKAIAGMSFDV
jgi:hypothetical protein